VSVSGTGTAAARRCRGFNEAVLDRVLASDDVTTVILGAHWTLYATGTRYGREADGPVVRLREHEGGALPSAGATNEAVFGAALERTVAALSRAGKEVVILGPVPEVGRPVPWTLALAAWRGRDVDIRPGLADFDERNRIAVSTLAGLGERGLATVVFPHLALCEGEEGRCRVESGGRTLYTDDNHLTRRGAGLLARTLEGVLRQPPH
jgi:hypothetical protein